MLIQKLSSYCSFIKQYNFIKIGLVGRVFANGPGDWGSIPGQVIPKTLKMVLDTSLLNTQHYKVRIKGKVEQSRKRSGAPLHLGVVVIEKGAFESPSTIVPNNYIIAVKLGTLVEGDPKAPFSIATTPRYRGGCYSLPLIAPLYP